MRLLHVVSSMDPKKGGVSQAIRNIIFNQEFAQHSVICLDTEEQKLEYDNFPIFYIGKGISGFQFHKSLLGWLINHLSDYDIIVVHGIWQYHNIAVFLAKLWLFRIKTNVPKVAIMPHGMLDPYFQIDSSRKLKAIRNEIIWRLTEKLAINSSDVILFTCQQELELAKKTFKGYSPKRELNVGLGVESPPAYTNDMKLKFQKRINNSEAYWLFLSRIHPKKGIDILIKAYLGIYKDDSNIPDLVIAGPLEGNFSVKMQELAKVCNKIHFTGMLQGDEKWGAFYGCDAFILPSHQENFGIAIVEAIACNKSVIISNKVNIWNEIAKGSSNYICEDNIQSLKESLRLLINRDFNSISSNYYTNINLFQEVFNIKSCAKNFIKKLQSI